MSDEPDNLILRMLRRLDEKLDRIGEDVSDLKFRVTTMERQLGELRADEQAHYAAGQARFDRLALRLDRIERRLNLVDTP